MADTEAELWDRLESLEDAVLRLVAMSRGQITDEVIEGFRSAFPYKRGNAQHWVRNNES